MKMRFSSNQLSIGGALSLWLLLVPSVIAQPTLPDPGTNTFNQPSQAQIAAAEAAQAAQQASNYATFYAPWVVQDLQMGDGSQLTGGALQIQAQSDLLVLSTNLAVFQAAQQTAVTAYLASAPFSFVQSWIDTNGVMSYIDRIDEGGAMAIKQTHNLESAQTVGAQKLWPGGSTGLNLAGTNVLMAQWDGGDLLTNHSEFATNGQRAFLLDGPSGYGVQDHPTHVAGTMMAWGVNASAKGFSNRGKVTESYFGKDLAEMPRVAATNGVRESNHSYGYTGGWGIIQISGNYYWLWNGDVVVSTSQDWHFGFYTGVSQTNDQIIYTAQTYLPVFSAGNENGPGQDGPATQPFGHYEYSNGVVVSDTTHVRPLNDAQGGFNTLTGYQVSKNELVVGAVGQNTNGYTSTNSVTNAIFSSMGPTADGRIKPDVVADGVNVYSTYSSNTASYGLDSGTSMAAPAVTGTLGLLTGFYNQLYPTNAPLLSGTNAPLSSTLRGILIHTADQLGTNIGPSYIYGWGLLDAVAAANLITNNYASASLAHIKEVRLISGDHIEFPVTLTNGVPFRATTAWTDPPGSPTAVSVNPTNRMLVNDLDLRVISPNGTTNFPYVLNRNSPASAATKADNAVDNVEQVYIPTPTNGTYTVRITHKGNLVNDHGQTSYQNLSIMLSGNIALPPTTPNIFSIYPITTSNTVALAWSSDVGRVYRVQYVDNITSGVWQNATGELSATKTNTVATIPVSGVTNRFYRIAQVR